MAISWKQTELVELTLTKKERPKSNLISNETEVHVAKERVELDSFVEIFKLWSREETTDNNNVNNSFGENNKLDWLIIMDDVSGIADVSKKFENFLTISRKFGYNCGYVFHVIVPASQIWQKNYFSNEYI